MKKFAKEIAALEFIIQTSVDTNAVNVAKAKQMKLTESADLELSEMIELDTLIAEQVNKMLST
jgi:carbamate kinase